MVSINDVTITTKMQHNKHSQAAIEAVASALAANARALQVLAEKVEIRCNEVTGIKVEAPNG